MAAEVPTKTSKRKNTYVVPSAEGRRALLKGVRTAEEVERATRRFAEAARKYAKEHRRGATT